MYNTIIVNVDELWLKGKNRPLYYKALRKHVKAVISHYHDAEFEYKYEHERQVATSETPFSKELIDALSKVPGIHSLNPSMKLPMDDELIAPTLIERWKETGFLPKTFKVITKRVNKQFHRNSMELSRWVGHLILKEFRDQGLKVDVHKPDTVVNVRILSKNIYVSYEMIKGIEGLPWDTSGHLVTMLSGGFDSPVASYLMMKRGCKQSFCFFYAYPYVGDDVRDKIIEITKVLAKYQPMSYLYVIPFGEVQNFISKQCREEYRTLLFRHFMIKSSELVAKRIRAQALLTGDALGQVSSQTIHNLSLLDQSTDYPILRPLVGHNKIEIINLSKQIGTHDVSIIPHDDACSLFAPKHPVIKPDRKYWSTFLEKNEEGILKEVEKCVDEAELLKVDLSGEVID